MCSLVRQGTGSAVNPAVLGSPALNLNRTSQRIPRPAFGGTAGFFNDKTYRRWLKPEAVVILKFMINVAL